MSIALFITEDTKLKMRFSLAVAYGASVGGILTPIGTPPNLILLGVMQEHNMEVIPFFQWMWMVAPLSLLMLIMVTMVLAIGVDNVPIHREAHKKSLDTQQKKVLFIMFWFNLFIASKCTNEAILVRAWFE
jgi:sodium-dependent dicarboxylate transporter 2/3/5